MNITNDIVKAYTDSLYTPVNNRLIELRHYAEEHHVPVILKDSEELLRFIAGVRRPGSILEIGCAIGYSASVFAFSSDCMVTTIEADETMYETACKNISDLGIDDRVTIIHGDAHNVLEALHTEKNNCYDIVFIDAAKSHYREFWDLSLPLCRDDALIICDNILMKGMTASDEFDTKKRYKTSIKRMRSFVEYIKNQPYADTCILPVGDGMSLSIINKEKIK